MQLETTWKKIYTTELIAKPYPNPSHHRESGKLLGLRWSLRVCFSYISLVIPRLLVSVPDGSLERSR